MSQILLRGLRLLEIVDFSGPITVSALARELAVDKATASRLVTACEAEGWVVRDPDGISIGPRASLLGQGAAAGVALRAAEPLVHTVCGVTGMLTQAVALVGGSGVALTSADASGARIPYGLTTRFPLWLSAAGKALSSQLTPDARDRLLPSDPFPATINPADEVAPPEVLRQFRASLGLGTVGDAVSRDDTTRASGRAELDAQLDAASRDGVVRDRAELMPGVSCIAVPWPQEGLPAALVCISTTARIDGAHELVERALRAAAASGATRDRIVTAAAHTGF